MELAAAVPDEAAGPSPHNAPSISEDNDLELAVTVPDEPAESSPHNVTSVSQNVEVELTATAPPPLAMIENNQILPTLPPYSYFDNLPRKEKKKEIKTWSIKMGLSITQLKQHLFDTAQS